MSAAIATARGATTAALARNGGTTTTTTSYAPSLRRSTTIRRPMSLMAMASMTRPSRAASGRRARLMAPPARATDGEGVNNANAADVKPRTSVYGTEFGYTRKDIFLLGFGLIGLGYVMYYGLQAIGMEPGMAGNWVQLLIFLGICVGYVSTYVYRVATKQMTYVKQLEQYEEAVMRRRLEEMTEAEVSQMVTEADAERAAREARRAAAAAAAAAAGPASDDKQ
jgi:hypothetical protein